MTRGGVLLLAAVLGGCRGSAAPPAPVLTLLPAAFEGGSRSDGSLCLAPGQSASVTVHVHRRSVTFTLRGTVAGAPLLDVSLGPESADRVAPPASKPMEQTFRLRPPPGDQVLRLALAPEAAGEVCLGDVALTQP